MRLISDRGRLFIMLLIMGIERLSIIC